MSEIIFQTKLYSAVLKLLAIQQLQFFKDPGIQCPACLLDHGPWGSIYHMSQSGGQSDGGPSVFSTDQLFL